MKVPEFMYCLVNDKTGERDSKMYQRAGDVRSTYSWEGERGDIKLARFRLVHDGFGKKEKDD